MTSIGYLAFASSGLTQVTIPNGVTNITSWAFSYCPSLANVVIGDGVSTINYGVFYDCPMLANVTVGNRVAYILQEAFFNCPSLTAVYFRGNAPILDISVFLPGDNHATANYLPGATGWNSTLGGLPVVLWNPPVPFNYTTNGEMITIVGYTGAGAS